MNEIIESICAALGRKLPRLSLPVGPARALVGLIEKGSRVIGIMGNLGTRSQFLAKLGHVPRLPGQAPSPAIPLVTREMIDKYTADIAVEGSFIQKELGFVPQYDLKTGWEETIREMQEPTKESYKF